MACWQVAGACRGCNIWERGRVQVPSHQQLLAPRCMLHRGALSGGGSSVVVAGSAATWFVLLTTHMGRFGAQSHLCPGTLHGHHSCLAHPMTSHRCMSMSPAHPLSLLQLPPPKQLLLCTLQHPPHPGVPVTSVPTALWGAAGGSTRDPGVTLKESSWSDTCSMGLKRVSQITPMRRYLS